MQCLSQFCTYGYKFCFYPFFRMTEMNENPWAVTGSRAFIFYCCPECEFKSESEKTFIQHAVKNHKRVSTFSKPIKK